MIAIWIAGLLVMLLMGLLFALALCRCAMLADRDVAQHLTDSSQSRTNSSPPEKDI